MAGSTNFPGSLDSHTSASPTGFGEVVNLTYTTFDGAHSIGATTLTVVSTTGFPTKGYLILSESTHTVVPEVVSYTGTTGTTFTGVSALTKNWASGDRVSIGIVAAHHNDLAAGIVAAETKLGTGSSTPSANTVLRGTGSGTSAYGQIMNADVATSAAIALSKVNITDEAAPSGGLATGDKIAAYDVSAAVNAATTAGAILALTTGGDVSIASTGVATIGAAKVTAAMTDASVARQNLMVNGGFENWSLGVGPFTTHNATTADGWTTAINGTDTGSFTRVASSDSPVNGSYCMEITATHGTGFVRVQQLIANPLDYAGRTVTASVRVKSGGAGRITLGLNDGVTATASSANTGTSWETLTVTKLLSSSPTLLRLFVNSSTANDTFYVDNAVLTVGSYASEYVAIPPGEQAARYMLATLGNVAFPAAQIASAGANVLDDYEEGTWTPTLIGSTTAGTQTYSSQTGTYTKVGRFVSAVFSVVITAKDATIAGDVQVGALPFAIGNTNAGAGLGEFSGFTFTAGYTQLAVEARTATASVMPIYQMGSNAAVIAMPVGSMAAASSIAGTINYHV